MSDKETPFNLFSSSKEKQKQQTSSLRSGPLKRAGNPRFKLDRSSQEIFDKIQVMQEELKSKVDEITRKTGLSKEDVIKMANTQAKSKLDLEKMNRDLEEFSNMVWNTVGKDVTPLKVRTDPVKDRKAKTLGSRRNWMRMP